MTASTEPILRARGLVKSYDGRRVVDTLDLDARPGQVVGLLGPNGAGKTTTLRMLYGRITPESGSIAYDGLDFAAHRSHIKRRIGVCTQDDTLDDDFTVEQNLRVYANYFRPRVDELDARIAELMRTFDLGRYARAWTQTLSGGFRRRLLIARSVIHSPRVLFLDEPTTGLDPSARVEVWGMIDHMRASGMAVILTTHYMDEAEQLSDALVVLSEGRAVATGDANRIIHDVLGEHVLVIANSVPERDALVAWLKETLGAKPQRILGQLHVPVRSAGLAAFTERFSTVQFSVRPPTLDDLFLELSLPLKQDDDVPAEAP